LYKNSRRWVTLFIQPDAECCPSQPQQLVRALGNYDRATAIQAFSALSQQDSVFPKPEMRNAHESAEIHVKTAFRDVLLELRNHSLTREKNSQQLPGFL